MKKLFNTPRIGMTFGDCLVLVIITIVLIFVVSCSNPYRKPYMYRGSIGNVLIFSHDDNRDGKIDYFQHYIYIDGELEPIGRPIYPHNLEEEFDK